MMNARFIDQLGVAREVETATRHLDAHGEPFLVEARPDALRIEPCPARGVGHLLAAGPDIRLRE